MPVGTEEITGLLDKIIARYKPGGEFGKAELALLERAKVKSLATTAQGMVSAGLAGTTAGVGAGRKWEEEVGMPSRLRLEDIRTERLTQAMGAKAGYIERAATREEQAALAKEQMELEEKFRNKQISIQEYLALSDRLRAKSGAGSVQPSTLPEGFGEFSPGMSTGGGGGAGTGGGYGAGYGGAGAGYGEAGGVGPGHGQPGPGWQYSPPTGDEEGPGTPLGGWEPPPGPTPRPGTMVGYTNVGTPDYPSWVQSSMMSGLLGVGKRLAE